ncbi:hypothetical protein NYR78_02990 [Actinobacillus equuli subsp. haemolyticus]|nr:hypothetical protein NYR78_02990 [Actinobacillus equuli subsp. haemolyticus]
MEQHNNVLADIRTERERTHGKFSEGAEVFADLTAPIVQAFNDGQISKMQYYGLTMAMAEVTRILVGNSNEADHWVDGANYFLLGGGINE